MASSTEYLEYVLDLLQDAPAITHKKMMGEYLLYSAGVLFGGVYDDRLLLKDTPAARKAFSRLEVPARRSTPCATRARRPSWPPATAVRRASSPSRM